VTQATRHFDEHNFTLLELLAVCTIIAILASLLLSAVNGVRGKAHSISCRSQLRQIGLAAAFYPDEFDGFVSPADFGGVVDSWINYFSARLCVSSELFRCPAYGDIDCFNPYGGNTAPYDRVELATYIMNTISCGEWSGANLTSDPSVSCGWGNGTTAPVRLQAVRNPHDKIVLTEFLPGIATGSTRGILRFTETDHGNLADQSNIGRPHHGQFNLLFGDGHVNQSRRSQHEQWAAVAP
jgi:prepilin-type processing-associated H-X9-DG protein